MGNDEHEENISDLSEVQYVYKETAKKSQRTLVTKKKSQNIVSKNGNELITRDELTSKNPLRFKSPSRNSLRKKDDAASDPFVHVPPGQMSVPNLK